MRGSRKQIQIKLKQGISFLLVLLFVFISAAQVLHTHTAPYGTHQEQHGEEEQLQLLDKCSVCDYYLHIQSKQIFSNDLFVLPPVFARVVTTTSYMLTGFSKVTIQGFTNKGPPHSL
ncbi:hypothetical protein OQX61_21110 [Pedobacter sp. PLR]|uniref:hypothetical protein n=1 Tax=Pedobacter sp. PLR TaxID=2994465 RepID=UPI00224760B9|nr:hypothetical protein [Pedobacter sp. PLR]MCX2453782.1 hypothetical protein [Pedobacter sp. PLR]